MSARQRPAVGVHPAVVLAPGLWMTGLELALLMRRLRGCGFQTYRFRYPTTRQTPQENAASLSHFIERLPEPTVHLVGHSLGGMVILHLFHRHRVSKPGRVVIMGTPAQGSRVAGAIADYELGRRALGHSVDDGGLLEPAPAWQGHRELGVIAGNRGVGTGRLLSDLPEPNDGTVAVEETRVDGATAHIVLATTHMAMVASAPVARHICHFLHEGRFGD